MSRNSESFAARPWYIYLGQKHGRHWRTVPRHPVDYAIREALHNYYPQYDQDAADQFLMKYRLAAEGEGLTVDPTRTVGYLVRELFTTVFERSEADFLDLCDQFHVGVDKYKFETVDAEAPDKKAAHIIDKEECYGKYGPYTRNVYSLRDYLEPSREYTARHPLEEFFPELTRPDPEPDHPEDPTD